MVRLIIILVKKLTVKIDMDEGGGIDSLWV